jgi:hypothetical protein
MTDYFIQVKNKIVEKLQSISELKYVYKYKKGELGGYPCATVYNSEYNPEWADTSNDKDVYIFVIHIYHEIPLKGEETADQIIDKAWLAVTQAFQQDFTLGGLVNKLTIKGRKGEIIREIPDLVAEITLTCEKLVFVK